MFGQEVADAAAATEDATAIIAMTAALVNQSVTCLISGKKNTYFRGTHTRCEVSRPRLAME